MPRCPRLQNDEVSGATCSLSLAARLQDFGEGDTDWEAGTDGWIRTIDLLIHNQAL